jgi:argininosuccinate lyase
MPGVTITVLRNIRVNEARTREAASRYLNATELMTSGTQKGTLREAHEAVGRAVVLAIEQGRCRSCRLPACAGFPISLKKMLSNARLRIR